MSLNKSDKLIVCEMPRLLIKVSSHVQPKLSNLFVVFIQLIITISRLLIQSLHHFVLVSGFLSSLRSLSVYQHRLSSLYLRIKKHQGE